MMGYGLTVYAVNIEQLQAVCGGGDMALYDQILHRFGAEIGDQDVRFGHQIYHQTDPSIAEGIRQLLLTGRGKSFDAYIYGYGLEYIVRYLGKPLNNAMFYPCDLDILSATIGDLLTGVQIENLVFRGLLADVIYPDDFPTYGHLTTDEVASAAVQMKGVLADYVDRDMDERAFIASWLEYAAQRHEGLVGYYY
jgi:hypothetical protein